MPSVREDQFLYAGLIRLHILHHAAKKPFFGLWMKEELEEHGYRISPGTLYPLLHGLEKKGLVTSLEKRDGKTVRRFYKATSSGRLALVEAKRKVKELHDEIFEKDEAKTSKRKEVK